MNVNIKSNWQQIKGILKQQWANLTTDDDVCASQDLRDKRERDKVSRDIDAIIKRNALKDVERRAPKWGEV